MTDDPVRAAEFEVDFRATIIERVVEQPLDQVTDRGLWFRRWLRLRRLQH
jgi:hypothetical protein